MPRFGRSVRHLWELSEGVAFLNHGSFGACPKVVLAEQDRIRKAMESHPDLFFRENIVPTEDRTGLRTAASRLAAFVNVDGNDLAFVENTTAGIQAVLRSIDFAAGDRILITDHTYNAVRLMVEARCAETGARPLVVPIGIPTSREEIIARFRKSLTPSVKLAIVDHITSPTALVFPLEEIIPELRSVDALVLVDGAHAVGHIPLNLAALQPDWYVSNAHKWLFAPKGSAFLYASMRVAARTRPNVISHHIAMGFPRSFDFTGTRDNSAWLAVPAAIEFFVDLDPEAVRDYQHRLLATCSDLLAGIGARGVSNIEMCAAMRSFVLPQGRPATAADAESLVRSLWERNRIRAQSYAFAQSLLLRVSAQVYVDEQDLQRLREALDRDGWPGR